MNFITEHRCFAACKARDIDAKYSRSYARCARHSLNKCHENTHNVCFIQCFAHVNFDIVQMALPVLYIFDVCVRLENAL